MRIIEQSSFITTDKDGDFSVDLSVGELPSGDFIVNLWSDALGRYCVRQFASIRKAQRHYAAGWAELASSPAWAEVRPIHPPTVKAIQTSRQLGMFGAQAGKEIGSLTGSQGSLFAASQIPTRRNATDERIARQYDPAATPLLFGGAA